MDKVSLHSKSNTSLTIDPASYPKDLDPFGEDGECETNETPKTERSSVIEEQSYPSTFDPFADDEEKNEVKSTPRKSRASLISHEKTPKFSDDKANGVNLNTSINPPVSDYDESLDPFGGDEDSNSKIDYRKSTGSVKETKQPAVLADTNSESNINNINDDLSIQSEVEPALSSELARRSGEERDSYSNQNSPVPVPPRRKNRNVSPSTKSLNRASYSASSLERTPSNGISSPISQNPNRLSAAETDTYLSHSISNLSTRSTSPIITVRSSPIRSRKKRRAPDPPGFPPSGSAASPITPNSSLVLDNSFNSTIESRHEATNESVTESSNESKIQTTSEPISKHDNGSTSEEIKEQATDLCDKSVSGETSEQADPQNDVSTSEEIKEQTSELSDEPASIETIEKASVQNVEPTSEETREKTSELSDESCSTETSVQSTKSDNDSCSLKTSVKSETNNEHSEEKNGQTTENNDLVSSEPIVEQTPETPNCVPASEPTNEKIQDSEFVEESSKDSNNETSKDGCIIKPNLDSTKPHSEQNNSQQDTPNSL